MKLFYLFFVSIFAITGVKAQEYSFTSSLLSMKHGLPDNNINCIMQDNKGFMWFGTRNGLCSYDGYRFINYYEGEENSISYNYIRTIYQTGDQLIWVGTFGGGLNMFDPISETFYPLDFVYADSIMIESFVLDSKLPDKIYSIVSRKPGEIWVGTQSGLYCLKYTFTNSLKVSSIKRYKASNTNNSICDNKVFHLVFDSKGILWVSSNEGGLSKFTPNNNRFENFYANKGASNLPSNQIMFTYEDSKKNIWIGTWGKGLCYFNQVENKFYQYHNTNNKNSLIGNNIYTICEDNSEHLWIGAIYSGFDRLSINSFNHKNPVFNHHWQRDGKNNLINSNVITAINKSNDGIIWVSVLGIGIYKIYQKKNFFIRQTSSNKVNSLSGNDITAISADKKGRIWIGTWGYGVNMAKIDNKELSVIKKLKHKNKQKNSLSSDSIYSIITDSDDITWIGAWSGLNKIIADKHNNILLTRINYSKTETARKKINTLHEDVNGTIWVGTENGGLNFLNKEKSALLHFHEHKLYHDKENKISNSQISCIYSFKSYEKGVSKELWLGSTNGIFRLLFYPNKIKTIRYYSGTGNSKQRYSDIRNFVKYGKVLLIGTSQGLSKFNLNTNTFYDESFFPGQYITSLLPDSNKTLWIGSIAGLFSYDLKSNKQKQFYEHEYGIIHGYNHNACYLGNDGMCFFGSNRGLVYFYPDTTDNTFQPEVVFTDLKINYKQVKPGKQNDGREILKKTIKETKHITLRHTDKIISVEFAAMSYFKSENNRFAYKLEGHTNDWIYTPIERAFVTYSNLPHGNYTLKVMASNKDDDWTNKISELHIKILPPFWKTWWAYSIYFLLTCVAFYFYWRFTINKIKLRETVKFERFKREKEEELSHQRIQFFTNVSHELRTPLTLIAGPLEQIIKQTKENSQIQDKLSIIQNNSNKLLKLIKQLLEFRKIEFSKEKLLVSEYELISETKRIFNVFEYNAIEKNIRYRLQTSLESIKVWFELDKYDKIITNLLSNAFKYNHANGEVCLSIKECFSQNSLHTPSDISFGTITSDKFIEIELTDTGKGIDKKDIKSIFERFYRVKNKDNPIEGTGIGLSVVKELVILHYGQIGLSSKLGKGSQFIIRLPLGNSHLKKSEIAIKKEEILRPESLEINIPIVKASKRKKILIVEDNKEMRQFIYGILEPYFSVLEADNGKVGLKLALEVSPDLIVSDIMMPEMDGITFCNYIKSNVVSSHIPFLLLTAKSSLEHNIEGLEAGADDYISKPFSPKALLLRVKNRFETQDKLKERFSNDIYLPHNKLASNPTDENFLAKLIKYIDKNIASEDLDINTLISEFGMSKSTFSRKLKQLTNQSPADFVNSYRMKLAARLLLSKQYSIKEIAFQIGFSDSRYFSTRFKKYFKVTPTEYLNQGS